MHSIRSIRNTPMNTDMIVLIVLYIIVLNMMLYVYLMSE
uniref:Uncharacterized protein n=1 Tax=Acinetobacter phage vB_Ab_1137_KEN_05 TaxID=3143020 RepID=A0AAU8KZE0_9VIRU